MLILTIYLEDAHGMAEASVKRKPGDYLQSSGHSLIFPSPPVPIWRKSKEKLMLCDAKMKSVYIFLYATTLSIAVKTVDSSHGNKDLDSASQSTCQV